GSPERRPAGSERYRAGHERGGSTRISSISEWPRTCARKTVLVSRQEWFVMQTYLHGEPSGPLKGRPPEPFVRNPRPHPASPAHHGLGVVGRRPPGVPG